MNVSLLLLMELRLSLLAHHILVVQWY